MKAGPGLIYSVLSFGLICLFIFSEEPFEPDTSKLHRRHLAGGRQYVVRPPKTHEPITFDPLVAEVQRRHEDRSWEQHYWGHQYTVWAQQAQQWVSHVNQDHSIPPPEQMVPESETVVSHDAPEAESQPKPWDNFNYSEYAEEFDGDDYVYSDHFNISHRLEILFPQLDINPSDGFVSLSELQYWHELSALRVTNHRTERDMEVHDLNRDGLVSLAEYLPHITPADIELNSLEVGGVGWWAEQFENADLDRNGALNFTEFHEFLHPEDSKIEKIHRWLVRQELRGRSQAHDGKLTWQDFHQNVFDVIRDYGAEEAAPELAHLNPYRDMEARKQILSKASFDKFDTNKDGFITEEEAEPFISTIRPGEFYYAKTQAEHLIEQADDNKDGVLSLQEMLTHPYVFYGTAYDHGDHSYSHDELR